ncbi:MAG: hypothetical protein BIP78_0222 [Candidatus Bipolaricaulis sibiricus]|uniref:Uncharacterized protein n=1 Tax=Bipolaricaulis sibiricus TaxID=2501609 RepID=A0A410FST5_BIPS1|nr:MAG: hypothetical protein BIP78_0222 [Candidatus Bipolaricaulis sibiricus]
MPKDGNATERRAIVVLPPGAARRLIARGVARLPSVQRALRDGLVVVTLGTTNAYVAEELLGAPIERERFCAGYIGETLTWVPPERQAQPLVLEKGTRVDLSLDEVVTELKAGDVVVKGANVLDPSGVCGVFMASPAGGTVGKLAVPALARGVEVVIPISAAKSIHGFVTELAREVGVGKVTDATGFPIGLFPLTGTVVTEAEAIALLYGVRAEHLATGGVGPGGGAVTLFLVGEEADVRRAFAELAALAQTESPPKVG